MSIGKLILHSSSEESPIAEADHLIISLQEIGLLGHPIERDKHDFFTGKRFLQLISFVGCSTNVCLTPDSDHDVEFCHLTIKGPFGQPQLFSDNNIRPPRCNSCREQVPNWQDNIDGQTLQCHLCGNVTKLGDISWGRRAGYGRIFIEITNIFPGEARPVHDLLENLENLTRTEWDYFFTQA